MSLSSAGALPPSTTMQFSYNSDYPGLFGDDESSSLLQWQPVEAHHPEDFVPVQPLPCAPITTRIYHPLRQQTQTVPNVLVRTAPPPSSHKSNRRRRPPPPSGHESINTIDHNNNNDDSSSDGFMSSSSSDEEEEEDDDAMDEDDKDSDMDGTTIQKQQEEQEEIAYWVQRTVREAIYGRVLSAIVLKRTRKSPLWHVTSQRCAIKEMSWQHIRRERDRLAEDPIKEVAAMQHLQQTLVHNSTIPKDDNSTTTKKDVVTESFQSILQTNVMMPLDLLSDDRFLYSVMPYCNGGELFERLDVREKFTEPEARYWMLQVLNGVRNLQIAGVCHRDLSLENLLVHESGALVIDMGMCLKIPIRPAAMVAPSPPPLLTPSFRDEKSISQQMQNMSMNTATASASPPPPPGFSVSNPNNNGTNTPPVPLASPWGPNSRYLIRPQGTCGKWIYMSPEIYKNQVPFDGHAVDMWAAGVILFLMLTGFPPWERACLTDERFKYMTQGYLVQMLTEWDLGLSSDAMDLLQRMLFLDPKDRLSLEQVLAHPWMQLPYPTASQMMGL